MSKYEETKQAIIDKVEKTRKPNGKRPTASHTGDLISMTQAMMNSPEYERVEYSKNKVDENGEPKTDITKPGARYREAFKPMLKSLGLDKEEVNQIDEYNFSKEQAAALVELSGAVLKDYVKAGRKYVFPINEKDETQMSIAYKEVEEKVNPIKKFEIQDDGRSIPVDTGKKMKTKKHYALQVSNSVPAWLKEEC